MSEKQEEVVVFEEEQVKEEKQEVTEQSLKENGLTAEEIKMAKDQGVIPEKEEKQEEEKEEKQEEEKEEKKEEKKEEFNIEDVDSFEKVHELYEKKPEDFKKLPRNVKALYHNSKGLYKKAKTEEQKRQEIEKKYEFDLIKNKASASKLEAIRQLVKKEGLTIEELERALAEDKPVEKEEKKEEAVNDKQQQFLANRISEAEKLGKIEYDNFDEIVSWAQEVTHAKPRYLKVLQDALLDENLSDKDLVDTVVDIAKLSKNYNNGSEKSEKKEDDTISRMEKNSAKKTPSAALGTGNGVKNTKNYDDLTPEDVLRMSQEQYNKLPDKVRQRLLMET